MQNYAEISLLALWTFLARKKFEESGGEGSGVSFAQTRSAERGLFRKGVVRFSHWKSRETRDEILKQSLLYTTNSST